jgi:hypothetical protein
MLKKTCAPVAQEKRTIRNMKESQIKDIKKPRQMARPNGLVSISSTS